jgi:hypothetical protein
MVTRRLPVPIRGLGAACGGVDKKNAMLYTTARLPCHDGLGGSIDGDRGIEDFAGLAGSSSRDSSGIESAETEGDRAYYCTCAGRDIFSAVLPWLLPWPTPRMRMVVVVWQACTEARPGVQAL